MIKNTLVQNIIDVLKKHHLTVATCESVTGGMIVSHLIDVSGASDVVKGGIVSYQNEIKIKNVGVSKNIIDKYGVVSPQVAKEMTIGISNKMNIDIAIAITGNAGDKNNAIAYLCIKVIDKFYSYELISKENMRNNIRIDFTLQSLLCLQNILKNMDK